METNKCVKCLEELNIKYFYKDKRNKSGFRNVCKICEGSIKIPPTHVICIKCNEEKLFTDFPLWKNKCNVCVKIDRIESKRKTSSKLYKMDREYIDSHNKICIHCGEEKNINEFPNRKDSIDGHRNSCKICHESYEKKRNKIYKQENKKEIRRKDLIYRKNRMATDPLYKAKIIARSVIRKSLTKCGYTKNSRTFDILGCSYDEFKIHLESLFLTKMNWLNRHMWEIDHIVPLDFCKTEEECLKLNNYKNLRPIWRIDNQEKSNSITEKTDIYNDIISKR